MAHMTVSLPQNLYDLILSISGKVGPNWSMVAAGAFHDVIQDIETARRSSSEAIVMPYPAHGEYDIWQVRFGGKRGRHHTFVKVSAWLTNGSPVTPKDVLRFATEWWEREGPCDVIPRILTQQLAQELA